MIQDPNPTDDPEMEKFCEWLYIEGYTGQMAFEKLKEVWLRGRCDYYGARLGSGDYPAAETYEVLTYLYRKAHEQLQEHLSGTGAEAPASLKI